MTLRILWLSDRIIGGYSAYSKITYEMCTRLAWLGHHVAHIPMGRANKMGRQQFKKVMVYESGDHPFGEDVAIDDYLDWNADMMITCKEPWVFNHIHNFAVNFAPMAIIDHSPVSPSLTARLSSAFKIIAVSRFGQKELMEHNMKSTYIPHGVRTDVYRPLEDKAMCKKIWHMEPDDFVVGIVAMNRVRKMIPRMMRGYKRFLELNPDVKSHLLLWTNVQPSNVPAETPSGVSDVGVNLIPEIFHLGLGNPPNDVRWFPPEEWIKLYNIGGLPEWDNTGWDMVKLYNAQDAHLLCSGGEGAGLTLLEAQSCGVPVVTTDVAAGPEHVGSGYLVPWYDYGIFSTPGTRYVLPDIDKMADALTKVMNGNPERMARKARRFATRFDWDKILESRWLPFLDECESELKPKVTKEGMKVWS